MAAPSAVLEQEHREFVDAFESFVARELVPLDRELDPEDDRVPADLAGHARIRSADLGFYAGDYPEDVGGRAVPFAAMVALHHVAGRSGSRLALSALAGPEGPSPLLLRGTDRQRKQYLEPLVAGRRTRCLGMTEPQAGSDAFRITTTARPDADGWVLRGRKTFVSNADRADFALIVAAVDGRPAVFVLDRDTPGLHVGQRYRGMSGEEVFELVLDDVRVGGDALVGGDATSDLGSAALESGLGSLSRGRLVVAATCNGLAEYALSLGVSYARDRRAFGQAIGDFQHVQELLVTSRAEVEAAKLLTLASARLVDDDADSPENAALAKLTSSTTAVRVVDRALQVHGATGWVRGHPLEYLYRYVRMFTIVEGTTEIQKVIIARSLGLG